LNALNTFGIWITIKICILAWLFKNMLDPYTFFFSLARVAGYI
jgi:hypothetical protein